MFPYSSCYSKWAVCERTKVQTAQRKQPKKRNPTHLHLHSNVLLQPLACPSFKVCIAVILKYGFQYLCMRDTTIQPEKHSQPSFVRKQWPSWAKHAMTENIKTTSEPIRQTSSHGTAEKVLMSRAASWVTVLSSYSKWGCKWLKCTISLSPSLSSTLQAEQPEPARQRVSRSSKNLKTRGVFMSRLIALKWSERSITYRQTDWEERRRRFGDYENAAFYKRRTINRWPPPSEGPF